MCRAASHLRRWCVLSLLLHASLPWQQQVYPCFTGFFAEDKKEQALNEVKAFLAGELPAGGLRVRPGQSLFDVYADLDFKAYECGTLCVQCVMPPQECTVCGLCWHAPGALHH